MSASSYPPSTPGSGQDSAVAARGRSVGDIIGHIADYLILTKPRIAALVLVTTWVGFLMGSPGPLVFPLLLHALLGTAMVSGGGAALNQYRERVWDGRMRRTCERPLPAGRLEPVAALAFGLTLTVLGWVYLALFVNVLTALLGLAANVIYVLAYTPLKRMTSWCVPVGAVSGALPPVMGWTAAQGHLDIGAWVIFAVMFVWQIPHFIAIAWLYREDYARAGFAVASLVSPDGRSATWQIPIYASILALIVILPTVLGMANIAYVIGALMLGLGFLGAGIRVGNMDMTGYMRRVFHASLVYLPLLLIWLAVNRSV